MGLAVEALVLAFSARVIGREQPPQTLDEARAAFDPGIRPRQIALRRRIGKHEPAHRIRPVAGDDRIGVDDVLLRLRHLDDAADLDRSAIGQQRRAFGGAIDLLGAEEHRHAPARIDAAIGLVRHHPLREQRGKRFLHRDLARMRQSPRPEAGVEQVQNRVLDAADIVLHRHPLGDFLRIEGLVGRLAGKAQEVPRAVHKRVERVGLAPRRCAALGAVHVLPRRVAFERVAGDVEADILGQGHRQLVLGHRHHAAGIAVDEGDRRPPVTLAADAPVAQAPHGAPLAPAAAFGPGDDLGLGGFDAHAIEEAGVDDHPVPRLGLALEGLVGAGGIGRDDAQDRQPVFGGEFEVALVMPRHAHHRAGAVFHQHEVGDEHRQVRAREGVLRGNRRAIAQLFRRFERGRGGRALLALVDKGGDVRIVRQSLRDRVIGGDGAETCAEDRVGAGRIDRQLAAVGKIERKLQPLRLADPVLLHQAHFLGPVLKAAQPLQQIVGKVGDLEEPLVELALLDFRAAAPALAVDHLLVGEHGHVDRVPVDGRFLAIDQPRLVQIKEQRLFVAVIFRIAGGEFARPVEREADALQLRLHLGDVRLRPAARVHALFHRGVFGRHPEGVPAHRVQHLEPAHLLVARQHVAHRIVADVAHVDAPRGIGEHLEDVAFRLGAVRIGGEGARRFPCALPASVGNGRIETGISHFGLSVEGRKTQDWSACRRRSRALVRMMSSSFCTVAACTGASTQLPPSAT